MQIKSLSYSQHEGKAEEWYVEKFSLGKINLIVGKNATGKTRTLNVIGGVAKLLSGERKELFSSGNWDLVFEDNGNEIHYSLKIDDFKVVFEKLTFGEDVVLERGAGGIGTIKAVELDQTIKFQSPENELAAFARRDTIQHPFFEHIFKWANSLHHYLFGTQMGKDRLVVFVSDKDKEIDTRNETAVVALFRKAENNFGADFKRNIIAGMNRVNYCLTDIGVAPVPGIKVQGVGLGQTPEGLFVIEDGVGGKTFQHEISQGMFRVLSLLIHLEYCELSKLPSLILIDDIGEGLDFERSTSLITLLVERAERTVTQLIMSTNDRFVMNGVPLKYWCIIKRDGAICKVYNYENSKSVFEEFKFTGLSNFDFLSTEFFVTGMDEE